MAHECLRPNETTSTQALNNLLAQQACFFSGAGQQDTLWFGEAIGVCHSQNWLIPGGQMCTTIYSRRKQTVSRGPIKGEQRKRQNSPPPGPAPTLRECPREQRGERV